MSRMMVLAQLWAEAGMNLSGCIAADKISNGPNRSTRKEKTMSRFHAVVPEPPVDPKQVVVVQQSSLVMWCKEFRCGQADPIVWDQYL